MPEQYISLCSSNYDVILCAIGGKKIPKSACTLNQNPLNIKAIMINNSTIVFTNVTKGSRKIAFIKQTFSQH